MIKLLKFAILRVCKRNKALFDCKKDANVSNYSNALILYNPYYQDNVIGEHLSVLKEKGEVAFGKIRSKLRNLNAQESIDESYLHLPMPMQLFLTDYNHLFVARVTRITQEDLYHIAPSYYKQKDLEIEAWFVIEDIRELVQGDFAEIRDRYLGNFRTPHYGNHTYAIYGNSYRYPLEITMKKVEDYFGEEQRYYLNIYKSERFIQIKSHLKDYIFGERINLLHPDSLEHIISAEEEYLANANDPFYDFTGIIIKYSKAVEREFYRFFKELFGYLGSLQSEILEIKFQVQGISYKLADLQSYKPNLGTYKFLLNDALIQKALQDYELEKLTHNLNAFITTIQKLRNETAHDTSPSFTQTQSFRDKVLGIGYSSILLELLKKQSQIPIYR